ncbi:hypothetical protein VP501E541_P0125 [Vibrio phage 501E54-1]|nr:hypothetical protein VP501E541_P0125 [Vibrio phage 501E54-1]
MVRLFYNVFIVNRVLKIHTAPTCYSLVIINTIKLLPYGIL